jgi:hypothetical protein
MDLVLGAEGEEEEEENTRLFLNAQNATGIIVKRMHASPNVSNVIEFMIQRIAGDPQIVRRIRIVFKDQGQQQAKQQNRYSDHQRWQ